MATSAIRFKIEVEARARYAQGAFDGMIGRDLPIFIGGDDRRESGRLTAAEISEEGNEVWLTFEVTPAVAKRLADLAYVSTWMLADGIIISPIPVGPN